MLCRFLLSVVRHVDFFPAARMNFPSNVSLRDKGALVSIRHEVLTFIVQGGKKWLFLQWGMEKRFYCIIKTWSLQGISDVVSDGVWQRYIAQAKIRRQGSTARRKELPYSPCRWRKQTVPILSTEPSDLSFNHHGIKGFSCTNVEKAHTQVGKSMKVDLGLKVLKCCW